MPLCINLFLTGRIPIDAYGSSIYNPRLEVVA